MDNETLYKYVIICPISGSVNILITTKQTKTKANAILQGKSLYCLLINIAVYQYGYFLINPSSKFFIVNMILSTIAGAEAHGGTRGRFCLILMLKYRL